MTKHTEPDNAMQNDRLRLELIHRQDEWQIWPVTIRINSWGQICGRVEWTRDATRKALGFDPADNELNSLAAHRLAETEAERARARGWAHVEVREISE